MGTFPDGRADAPIFTPTDDLNNEHAASEGGPLVQVERPRNHLGRWIVVGNY